MQSEISKYRRHSIRLKEYDYSQAGAYYFTIVAQNRATLFGDISDGEMHLNEAGEMVWDQWNALPQRFSNIELDEFIVMPNHVHGILSISGEERRGAPLWSPFFFPSPSPSLRPPLPYSRLQSCHLPITIP